MNNNEKIKLNKSTIITLIICIIIVFFFICSIVIGFFSTEFTNAFWLIIRNTYSDIMFLIFQNIPFIGDNIIDITLALIILIMVYYFLIRKSSRIKYTTKQSCLNASIKIISLSILIIVISPTFFNYWDTLNNSITNFEKGQSSKRYKVEDLIDLNKQLQKKVISLSQSFDRIDGHINIPSKELSSTAINDLKNISKEYPFLKGNYPTKYVDISEENYQNNDYETMGITENFLVKIDYKINSIEKLNTITHELCHVKGIMRESEAVYCSIQAGIKSNNKYSQYAAYLEAFNRVNTVLYYIDPEKADEISDPIDSMCLTKNYKEICEIYKKELNNYIDDTDEISILSYKLKNYEENIKEFNYVLAELNTKYNLKFYINDKKVDYSKVIDELNNNSDKSIKITIKNDKETFNKISNLLKKHKDYFLSITQAITEEDEEYMTKQELIEFYLYPSEENNLLLILFDEYDEEYEYERVTRLLLEGYNY